MISDLSDLDEGGDDRTTFSQPSSFDKALYNTEYDRPDMPSIEKKFIRPHNNNNYPPQSGMQTSKSVVSQNSAVAISNPADNVPTIDVGVNSPNGGNYQGQFWNHSYPPFNYPDEYNMYNKDTNHYSNLNNYYENFEHKQTSCVSVSDHVSNCKVCSRLYKNDKTLYIAIIVILVVICILLLKKILDA